MQKSKIITSFPFYYGWIIVAASALGMLFSIPGQTIGVSVFTDHLMKALSLSRDQLSTAYMIGTLSSAAILSFSGIAMDKIGSRHFGGIVSILLGLLLVGLSFIDDAVAHLSVALRGVGPAFSAMLVMSCGFFLLRFLGQGSMTLVSRNLPMRWFTRRRGLVNAIIGTVVSFGFNVAPSIYDAIIQGVGWKGAWRISGVCILTLGTLIFFIVVRDRPEPYGLAQDGDTANDHEDSESDKSPRERVFVKSENDATLFHALRSGRFWLYGISLGLSSLYVTGVTFHIISIFHEVGISRGNAVAIFIPISILSVIINIGVSSLSDHIRLKYLLITMLAGLCLSMTGVFLLRPGGLTTAMIILGGGLNGGTFNALATLSWPRFYGTTHLGAISSFSMGIIVAGSALGPILYSLSLSQFGNYGAFSIALAGISLILLTASIILPERAPINPGSKKRNVARP